MGIERLTLALACVALSACAQRGAAPADATIGTDHAPARVRHAQKIVRSAQTSARSELFERFRARNGAAWRLLRPDQDVDAFRVFLRRAARTDAPAADSPAFDARDAESLVLAFVSANADVLGLSSADVAVLDVTTKALRPDEGPTPNARYAVRLRARVPMRGYEAFESVTSKLDLTVFVDADRQIRLFANDSRIHPRLSIDTRPGLEPDDPRVLANVVGRELFVAVDDPKNPRARVRELRRVSVGKVRAEDVVGRALTIWASPGPLGAYESYVLAYVVHVGLGGQVFRFIVDADTGDVLDDAAVPVVGGASGGAEEEP